MGSACDVFKNFMSKNSALVVVQGLWCRVLWFSGLFFFFFVFSVVLICLVMVACVLISPWTATHALVDPTVGTEASLQLAGVNQVNKECMWFGPQEACVNKFYFLGLWGLVVFSACLLSLLAVTAPVIRGGGCWLTTEVNFIIFLRSPCVIYEGNLILALCVF